MTAPTVVTISSTDQSRQHFADLNLHGDFNLKFLDDAAARTRRAAWPALISESQKTTGVAGLRLHIASRYSMRSASDIGPSITTQSIGSPSSAVQTAAASSRNFKLKSP